MHLVELLLPLSDNEGVVFPKTHFKAVERELTERFGGVTAYPRAPASGIWTKPGATPKHDEIVVYEVMVEELDVPWWNAYRQGLEATFRQEKLIVRAHAIELL